MKKRRIRRRARRTGIGKGDSKERMRISRGVR
jgi:hypothetical protein